MIELTHFPRVLADDNSISFGGSQDWFHNKWRALSGCASVSAVNLAAFDGIGFTPDMVIDSLPAYSVSLYRSEMNKMFRSYMTSGMMGFPDPDKYEERFREYAADNGVLLSSSSCSGWDDTAVPEGFIRERIGADRPVAILILDHSRREIDDITWHWMTVTGIDDGTGELIVSNYGRKERYSSSVVLEADKANRVHLLSFDIRRTD